MAKTGDITIFHNPNCGASRTVLAALREKGLEPKVIEYLKAGWTKPQLKSLLAAMKATPRDILRAKEPKAEGLKGASDEAILDVMVAAPILVERPIVMTPKGTALCRPADRLGAIL